jgi:hypothetical protein
MIWTIVTTPALLKCVFISWSFEEKGSPAINKRLFMSKGILPQSWYNSHMKKAVSLDQDKLVEKLAELEHTQWSEWTKYMLNNLSEDNIIKWKEQIKTKYHLLPEDQKWSDRRWAKKVIEVINKNSQYVKNELKTVKKN